MEALSVSTLVVLLAEMGDKTQLLALLLAARYRKPWIISLAIFIATLLNHSLAAWLGSWVSGLLSENTLRWLVAICFFAVAAWTLKPDKDEGEDTGFHKYGPFVATMMLFFFAEIGDKTQIATVVLAAQYQPVSMVILGSTIGMMLANVPVVFFGGMMADRLPVIWIRRSAASLFAVLGVVAIW